MASCFGNFFEENFGITTMDMVGEIGLIFRLYRVLLLKAIEAAAFCFAFCYNYAIHFILLLLTSCQFLFLFFASNTPVGNFH